jgi:hypothetical protein
MMDRNRNHREETEPSFSIYEFKGWLAKQPETDFRLPEFGVIQAKRIMGDVVGESIKSRLGLQRLEDQITQHNEGLGPSEAKALATAFKEHGGIITEMYDLHIRIKTCKGEFELPKLYTKLS